MGGHYLCCFYHCLSGFVRKLLPSYGLFTIAYIWFINHIYETFFFPVLVFKMYPSLVL